MHYFRDMKKYKLKKRIIKEVNMILMTIYYYADTKVFYQENIVETNESTNEINNFRNKFVGFEISQSPFIMHLQLINNDQFLLMEWSDGN